MSRIRKLISLLLKLSLLVFIGGAIYNWQMIKMMATYNTLVLPAMYGEPADQLEARTQDLRYLRKLTDIDRSFSPTAAQQFHAELDQLQAQADSLTEAQLYLGISKAVALADNGHSNTSGTPLYRQFKTIPAKLAWFADGLYIVRAAPEYANAVGQRVVAVEGRPLEQVVTELRQYRGGPENWRDLRVLSLIESPELLHAAGLASAADSLNLTLANEVQTSTELNADMTFPAGLIEDADSLPRRRDWMRLNPLPLADETADWKIAFTEQREAPFAWRSDNDQFLFKPLPGNGHYIRSATGFGSKELPVAEFYRQALADLEDASLDYMLVDFRFNNGGDYTRAIEFAKAAPAKIKADGKLYLATSANTFSAAIVTTAMLKFYAGDKAMIIGAPAGDREQFWAERGLSFKLPNSGLYINYATGYHDWNQGCESHPYCFTLNLIHGVKAGSLAPQVLLQPSYADYANGRDIVVDWVRTQH